MHQIINNEMIQDWPETLTLGREVTDNGSINTHHLYFTIPTGEESGTELTVKLCTTDPNTVNSSVFYRYFIAQTNSKEFETKLLNNTIKFGYAISEDKNAFLDFSNAPTDRHLIFTKVGENYYGNFGPDDTTEYCYSAETGKIQGYFYPNRTYYLWIYPITDDIGILTVPNIFIAEHTTTFSGTIPTYTITYNANGGSNAPDSHTKTHGITNYISYGKPRRTGYTFIGWSISQNGSVAFQPGDAYTTDADLTLYAVWQGNSYTLTIDPNGGTLPNGSTSAMALSPSLVFDGSNWWNLGAQTPTKTGYTFLGWYGNDGFDEVQIYDQTGACINGTRFWKNNRYIYEYDLYVSAKWQINKYSDTFDANGGTGGGTCTGDYGSTYYAPSASRSGYTFDGWYTEQTAGTKVASAGQNITHDSKNDKFYAQWKVNKYTDTFDANGGTGGSTYTGDYGSSYYAPIVSRNGYTFVGWYTAKTGGTEVAGQGQRMTHDASSNTFYARWTPNQYTLTIDPNGGVLQNGTTEAIELSPSLVFDSNNWCGLGTDYTPTKTGYTLIGWYTEAEDTGFGLGTRVYDQNGNCVNGSLYWKDNLYVYPGNITVYAQWQVNQYTDTFICNKQSFNEAITGDYGSTYTAPTPPTLTGFKFTGWWTQENGGTKVCGAGGSITHDEKNDTFYAQWVENSYTIYYDANGGSGAPASQTKIGGDPLVLSPEEPTRNGYLFQGWATAPNGMVLYQPGASYTADESATLYAIWKGANLVSKNCRACIQFGGSAKTCSVIVRHSGSDTKCKPLINHNDVK